jgi:predicted DCC family thiol-disulfide oxidoreductase YuxK
MGDDFYRIILFDGVCNLCNDLVQFIIKRDLYTRFRFTPLQSESGLQLLKQYGYKEDKFEFIVYIRGGKTFCKSTAVLEILNDLGGIWRFTYALIIIPKFIRDFIYNIVSKKRYQLFGRSDSCMIPTPGIKERFLE